MTIMGSLQIRRGLNVTDGMIVNIGGLNIAVIGVKMILLNIMNVWIFLKLTA